uniref:Uncharacterized protein MANES_18G027000 n=1 Tax=Rhizophora mucronata TaxID=61149 RepID=A0A2P2KUC0_RHIMU
MKVDSETGSEARLPLLYYSYIIIKPSSNENPTKETERRKSMSLYSTPARLTLLALLSATTFYCFYKSRRLKLSLNSNAKANRKPSAKGKLFFVSQTGTSKTLARRLQALLASHGISFDLVDPKDYEPEDLSRETLIIILASTWEDGKPPPNAKFLSDWLAESADDFRVGALLLSKCKFAVFGVGSRAYGATFNAVAKEFSRWLRELGATEILGVGEGDVDGGELDGVFEEWGGKLVRVLEGGSLENGGVLGNGVVVGGESDSESIVDGFESDDEDGSNGVLDSGIVDVEDIAGKGPSRRSASVAETNGKVNGQREMVTPVIRANLEKQISCKEFNRNIGRSFLGS